MFSSTTLVALAAVVATASAQAGTTIKVTVGKGGNIYTPNDIKVEIGTNIEFSFFPQNHTVTESSFKDPCHPLENGFFSTFVPTSFAPSSTNASTFTITVKDKKPIWLYCGQGKHCQTGMIAAINAPASGNTFEAFSLLAKNATASTSPSVAAAVGGILKIAAAPSGSASGSAATGFTTKTVQTTVTAVITTVITTGASTYTSTYPSTYATVQIETVPLAANTGGSTSTPSSSSSAGAAAATLATHGGMAGAILFAGLAML
ncbi:hypothetical protein WAI453_013638 [Rhynchosporium graminicola]